jgi:hypothetical protein
MATVDRLYCGKQLESGTSVCWSFAAAWLLEWFLTKGETMNREEALKIGKIIADRWYRNYEPTLRARQHRERMKKSQQKRLPPPSSKSQSQKILSKENIP